MTQDLEGREFSRSEVAARVEVRLESGVLVEGQARDVSLNGILFSTERSLPMGHPVSVTLVLEAGTWEERIETAGYVARTGERGVAITFTSIDAESMEHLRRLVLYNADDADRVDDEFQAHVGLKPKKP